MLKILLDFIWDFTFGLWGMGSVINYVQEGLPGLQSSFLSMIFNFESLITQAGVSFVTLIVEIDEYAILFIIVKFVKKILDVYGLQTDGDANGDILVLITNFFKAMVVAISFTLIWSWLSEIFIQFITDILGDYNVFATTGLDTLKQIGEQGKDTPLYAEAASFNALLSYRFPKKSGIVADSSFWLMTRVLLPRTTHARRLPINALPSPIQVDARPYFHPNCPA